MSLWNPSKPMTQPPGFRQITTVKSTPTSEPLAERAAKLALKEAVLGRRNRASATPFDRSAKGRT